MSQSACPTNESGHDESAKPMLRQFSLRDAVTTLGCHIPTPPPLHRNDNPESRWTNYMRKSKGLPILVAVWRPHRNAGGASVNRWQSLSLSHRAKSCNAECSPGSCSASQLFPARHGEEVGHWGSCPAGTGSRNQELGVKMSYLKPSGSSPIPPIHRHAFMQKSTMKTSPSQAPSSLGAGVLRAFPKILGSSLGW